MWKDLDPLRHRRAPPAPTQGRSRVGGSPVTGPRRDVALILQNAGLLPWKTVWQNANLSLLLAGEYPGQPRRPESWTKLGLGSVKRPLPSELSEGMKRRVGIARALSTAPDRAPDGRAAGVPRHPDQGERSRTSSSPCGRNGGSRSSSSPTTSRRRPSSVRRSSSSPSGRHGSRRPCRERRRWARSDVPPERGRVPEGPTDPPAGGCSSRETDLTYVATSLADPPPPLGDGEPRRERRLPVHAASWALPGLLRRWSRTRQAAAAPLPGERRSPRPRRCSSPSPSAFPLGLLIGHERVLDRYVSPMIYIIYPIPQVASHPLPLPPLRDRERDQGRHRHARPLLPDPRLGARRGEEPDRRST